MGSRSICKKASWGIYSTCSYPEEDQHTVNLAELMIFQQPLREDEQLVRDGEGVVVFNDTAAAKLTKFK